MPDIGEDTDYADRIATNADALKGSWNATLDELDAMAEELAAEGWETTAVAADGVAPEAADTEPTGRFGLTYTFVDNVADEVADAIARAAGVSVEGLQGLDGDGTLDRDAFDRYEVFQREADGHVYHVVAFFDDETGTALLVAGAYQQLYARALRETVVERVETYTHFTRLDETPIASFHHEEWEPFFPNAEARLAERADE
jgi:hypothetical protein